MAKFGSLAFAPPCKATWTPSGSSSSTAAKSRAWSAHRPGMDCRVSMDSLRESRDVGKKLEWESSNQRDALRWQITVDRIATRSASNGPRNDGCRSNASKCLTPSRFTNPWPDPGPPPRSPSGKGNFKPTTPSVPEILGFAACNPEWCRSTRMERKSLCIARGVYRSVESMRDTNFHPPQFFPPTGPGKSSPASSAAIWGGVLPGSFQSLSRRSRG